MEGENIDWDVQKPFDLFLNLTDSIKWRYLVDAFRNGEITYDFPLHQIQTVVSELEVVVDI